MYNFLEIKKNNIMVTIYKLYFIHMFHIIKFIAGISLNYNQYENDTCIYKQFIPLSWYFIFDSIYNLTLLTIYIIYYLKNKKIKYNISSYRTLCVPLSFFIGLFLFKSCYTHNKSYTNLYVLILYVRFFEICIYTTIEIILSFLNPYKHNYYE
jgi:hypothetical protein